MITADADDWAGAAVTVTLPVPESTDAVYDVVADANDGSSVTLPGDTEASEGSSSGWPRVTVMV